MAIRGLAIPPLLEQLRRDVLRMHRNASRIMLEVPTADLDEEPSQHTGLIVERLLIWYM